jgi:L-alanine-DL-glutamate epimerase-like enolase superfamily enzyme
MRKRTDISLVGLRLYFIRVATRVPLKFGGETVTQVTCARVAVQVENREGKRGWGWGETPLSAAWVWPGGLSYEKREEALKEFCVQLCREWLNFKTAGHAMELGHAFIEEPLKTAWERYNSERAEGEAMPWLAALVCCSLFDLALHDAYGVVNEVPTYETYTAEYMNVDLGRYLQGERRDVSFHGRFPSDFLKKGGTKQLRAWHLVGGKDLLDPSEIKGDEPQDGYPVLLRDWIRRDGLKCLKVKLCGTDQDWDYQRLLRVGKIAEEERVEWLSADFNCTVLDPKYVNEILDRLLQEEPRIYGMLLYVEQPFPYELEEHQIDVRSVSARKPLFMDESAHDWRMIRLGRSLGWSGVALKTCKTQTGALLSLCWARAHGMTLMVQDLTNPMLAQVPHLLLAAHAGTIMGVETNAMQFYPEASAPEARVHPGLYRRVNGMVDLSSLGGRGFGYRVDEMNRELPAMVCEW